MSDTYNWKCQECGESVALNGLGTAKVVRFDCNHRTAVTFTIAGDIGPRKPFEISRMEAELAECKERVHNAGFVEASRIHGAEITELRAKLAALEIPPPPHDCKTEAEKTAYAFGWWKALESKNAELAALAGQEPVAEKVHNKNMHMVGPNDGGLITIDEISSIPVGAKLYLAAGAREPEQPATRHIHENAAELLIEYFICAELGLKNSPGFTTEKQGESGSESHSWAFWILEEDTTSYLHEDGRIEWCGTGWEAEPISQPAQSSTGAREAQPMTEAEMERLLTPLSENFEWADGEVWDRAVIRAVEAHHRIGAKS